MKKSASRLGRLSCNARLPRRPLPPGRTKQGFPPGYCSPHTAPPGHGRPPERLCPEQCAGTRMPFSPRRRRRFLRRASSRGDESTESAGIWREDRAQSMSVLSRHAGTAHDVRADRPQRKTPYIWTCLCKVSVLGAALSPAPQTGRDWQAPCDRGTTGRIPSPDVFQKDPAVACGRSRYVAPGVQEPRRRRRKHNVSHAGVAARIERVVSRSPARAGTSVRRRDRTPGRASRRQCTGRQKGRLGSREPSPWHSRHAPRTAIART